MDIHDSSFVLNVSVDTSEFQREIDRCMKQLNQVNRSLAWVELKIAFRNWLLSLFGRGPFALDVEQEDTDGQS